MQLTSVILVGGGRMGKLIAQKLDADGGFAVEGIYDVDNADELDGRAPVVDLVIDFSNKAGLPHVLAYVERTGAALVSGTTGFDDEELGRLRALGQKTRVIHSFNYSLGVAALKRACAQAALALGEWDCEIVETHHNKKADAPSGTAVLLLDAVDPNHECAVAYGREGMVGERPAKEIGMIPGDKFVFRIQSEKMKIRIVIRRFDTVDDRPSLNGCFPGIVSDGTIGANDLYFHVEIDFNCIAVFKCAIDFKIAVF